MTSNQPERELHLELLGQAVKITGDGALLEAVARCFEVSAASSSSKDHITSDLLVNTKLPDSKISGSPLARHVTTDPPGAFQNTRLPSPCTPGQLVSALNNWAVKSTPHHYVFHAGAVALRRRAILLSGNSHSGKTTLTAALVRRGFQLLSDEVGAIEFPSRRLVGYPRTLWIRQDVLPILDLPSTAGEILDDRLTRMVTTKELGGKRAVDGADIALMVTPQFVQDANTALEPLKSGEAVLAFMGASCSQKRFKVEGLDFVIGLAREVPCYRLTFSNLQNAMEAIEAEFSRVTGAS